MKAAYNGYLNISDRVFAYQLPLGIVFKQNFNQEDTAIFCITLDYFLILFLYCLAKPLLNFQQILAMLPLISLPNG